MDHELVGLRGNAAAEWWRPVGGGPCALLAFAVTLVPVRPVWLWTVLILAVAALPWGIGAVRRRRRPYWRLSADGLELLESDGSPRMRYERSRIKELALSSEDGVLTVFHKFGRTEVGELSEMGFEPVTLFVTARRLGIPLHVLDGTGTEGEPPPSPDHTAEQRLLDQEAELLAAAHDLGDAPQSTADGGSVRLETTPSVPRRSRVVLVGALVALLSAIMVARIAVQGNTGFGARLIAGCWVLLGISAVLLAQRRLLLTAPVSMTISTAELRAAGRSVPAGEVAALVVGPGLRADPLSGEPGPDALSVLAFDHRLRLVARMPVPGLDPFQLVHALDDHGYRVITPEERSLRPSEYGLDGLPEIFSQVPGGRLVVADDGLGWADAAGDVVLKMPEDRIGGIELLTIGGHAWLRVYDAEGDEFFAAPLSALRIARTELRESARRAGLPVTDAEYDAYLSAAFHGTVSALATAPPAPLLLPPEGPGVLLDATRRSRFGTYGMSMVLCEGVSLAGAGWLGGDLGGFATTIAWAAPAGLLIGFGGYWLYDRNRAQLSVSPTGISVVTRLGKVEWTLGRESVGGVGIDDSDHRLPRLVVWGPTGRVLRRVTFPPDLEELRRACERYGLPWGPPDADRPAPPPPEL